MLLPTANPYIFLKHQGKSVGAGRSAGSTGELTHGEKSRWGEDEDEEHIDKIEKKEGKYDALV